MCFAFVQGITDENDMNFLRTLSLIKGRDKRIYKPKVAFYSSEGVGWGGVGGGAIVQVLSGSSAHPICDIILRMFVLHI